jgi:hypothetical protein
MGVAYDQPVSQWSQQEYFDADNNGNDANFGYGRDDIAIISSLSNGNNFGLKSDDHGDTQADATAITEPSITLGGVISTRQDRDVFAFSTIGGSATFTATAAAVGANLDIELTIKNSIGEVVATNNPTSTLDASIEVVLTGGDYTVEVDGQGVGSPTSGTPTGYTDYGSIGQYSLEASIEGLGQADVTPPAAPTGLAAAAGIADLSWNANTEPDLANYEVRYSATTGGPFTAIGTTTSPSFSDPTATTGSSYYVVVAIDLAGNTSTASNEASVTIADPDPARVAAAQEIIDGFEAFVQITGSYIATGGGYNGNGRGWFTKDTGTYPDSIANVLNNQGVFTNAIPTEPTGGDFFIRGCADRVGVFTNTDTTTSDPSLLTWWTNQGCTPFSTYQHLTLSAPSN